MPLENVFSRGKDGTGEELAVFKASAGQERPGTPEALGQRETTGRFNEGWEEMAAMGFSQKMSITIKTQEGSLIT